MNLSAHRLRASPVLPREVRSAADTVDESPASEGRQPMPKLTQRLVEQASSVERETFVWDTDVPGFGLRLMPSGSKSFIVSLRIGGRGGQQRRRMLGKPSVLSVEVARRKARLMVAEAKDGKDPVAALLAERRKLRVREVTELFLSQYVEVKRKPSYARECRRIIDRHLLPAFGVRPIADVNRAEITRWHQSLREVPYQANRCLAVLSRLMTWSIRQGHREAAHGNPCQYLEKYPERKRERYLSTEEIGRLAAALDAAADREAPARPRTGGLTVPGYALTAIRLLFLTGCRRDEIRTLQWAHVDLERRLLLLPDSKTGQKTILLSSQAASLLETLPKRAAHRFVFPGRVADAPINDLEKPWQDVRRVAGLDDVRLHDLRHTFASIAAGAGLSLPVIGKLLGHSQPATTARYAHIAANPAREAVERIGDVMQPLLQSRPDARLKAA